MLIRFEALGTTRKRNEFVKTQDDARRFWSLLLEAGWQAADSYLAERFPQLDVFRESNSAQLFFVAGLRAAVPLAELLVAVAPESCAARVGRPAASHARALRHAVEQSQVNLETSRVRAGFTRGHLLEVVVHVPFDVEGDDESLQIAAEVYLETRLGDQLMDRWIANVSIARIARTRGLLVLGDAADQADHYPLEQSDAIIARATEALSRELPNSKLHQDPEEHAWAALEIPLLEGSPLGDRTFASTLEPEALKAALEGMPFDSRRFTLGEEMLVWCVWEADVDFTERLRVRQEVEAALVGLSHVSLVGTGFGARRDFVDLWVVPDLETLERIGRTLCACTGAVQLRFYDSTCADEVLDFHSAR